MSSKFKVQGLKLFAGSLCPPLTRKCHTAHETPTDCSRRREEVDRLQRAFHPPPHVGGYEGYEIFRLTLMPFGNSAQIPVPEGHHENSPAFQRWGDGNEFLSPEGTVETGIANSISYSAVPSRLALRLAANPALKRWAIIKCPSGTSGRPALNFRTAFGLRPGRGLPLNFKRGTLNSLRAFTLIEIMIVVAIMGLIMAMGIPSLARAMRKEGMRKAVSDMVEACSGARAAAILTGQTADLVIRPQDKTISGGTFSATLPDNVGIEILGVNFVELQEADEARVHFYGNGTSDEFTIVLTSDEHKAMKISLEVVTGLADVEVLR